MIAGQVLPGNDHDLPTAARGYGRPRTHSIRARQALGNYLRTFVQGVVRATKAMAGLAVQSL